jgi:hypothetical protein
LALTPVRCSYLRRISLAAIILSLASAAKANSPPPPQITITAPADGLLTNASTVTVTGTAFASPGAEPVTLLTREFIAEGEAMFPQHLRVGNRWMNTVIQHFKGDDLFYGQDRADLLDLTTYELWEIKPDNILSGAISAGEGQIFRYLCQLAETDCPFQRGMTESFKLPRFRELRDGTWVLYRYWDASGGLVVYDLLTPQEKAVIEAAGATTLTYATGRLLQGLVAIKEAGEVGEVETDWGSAALTASVGVVF